MGRPDFEKLRGWTLTRKGEAPTVIQHEDVKKFFDAVWSEAHSYWDKKVKPDWEHNKLLYTDKYDLPFRQMPWQTKMKDPVVDNLVTRITYYFHRILVNIASDGNYFTVQHKDEARAKAYASLLRIILKQNDYPKKFTDSFAKSLVHAIMAHKIVYTNEAEQVPVWSNVKKRFDSLETKVRGKTKIISIDPYCIRLDPYGERYIIEIAKNVPYDEFKSAAKANRWINLEAVDALVKSETKDNPLPTVTLKYVYTKVLTDRQGNVLSPCVWFVVVNDKYVVHLDNYILPNGMFPYSVSNPMLDIYGGYGRSYVSRIADLVTHYVGFVNLALDGAYLTALGVHEYDMSVASADGAHGVTSHIEPGKIYPKDGPGNMINSYFPAANQTMGLLNLGYFLDRELQNKGYVNEFFAGQATAKGRPTLGEISLKTQESTAFFTDMASHTEGEKIQVDLRLLLYTQLMNLHASQGDIDGLTADMNETDASVIKGLTPVEIMADLQDLRIEVSGISGKIKALANFNRYLQIFNVIGNMPGVQSSTLVSDFVRKMFKIIDDSPEEVINMDLLEQLQAQLGQAALQQFSQPQQQPTTQEGQPAAGV